MTYFKSFTVARKTSNILVSCWDRTRGANQDCCWKGFKSIVLVFLREKLVVCYYKYHVLKKLPVILLLLFSRDKHNGSNMTVIFVMFMTFQHTTPIKSSDPKICSLQLDCCDLPIKPQTYIFGLRKRLQKRWVVFSLQFFIKTFPRNCSCKPATFYCSKHSSTESVLCSVLIVQLIKSCISL